MKFLGDRRIHVLAALMLEIKDLAGLAAPATKLLELVGKATGTLFEPARIVREAKAQAAALLIKTEAEIETEAIRKRAAARLVAQEIRKQENIEAVTGQAVALLSSEPPNGKVIDDDWINRFVLEAQDVSDARLQAVWAKLLAGEFQSPGTYPRRVLRVLKDLEPSEAELIDSLAGKLLWVENADGSSTPFLNSHVYEEWHGDDHSRKLLGSTPVESAALLRELGVIDDQDFTFTFSVEGPLRPDEIHLSTNSAAKIYSSSAQLAPEYKQPAFVRSGGSLFTQDGVPRIPEQIKLIEFDAWRITSIGVNLFMVTGREPDIAHLSAISGWLVEAGMRMK